MRLKLRERMRRCYQRTMRGVARVMFPSPFALGNESDRRQPDERVEPPAYEITSGPMTLVGNEVSVAADDGRYRIFLDFDRWDAHGFWVPDSRNTIHIRTPDGKAFQQIKRGVSTEWQQIHLPMHSGRDCDELRLALLKNFLESTKQSKHHPFVAYFFGVLVTLSLITFCLRFGPDEDRKVMLRALTGAEYTLQSETAATVRSDTPTAAAKGE